MGCSSCGGKHSAKKTYTVTFKDGSTKSYSSEIEAKAAISRKGGTMRVS